MRNGPKRETQVARLMLLACSAGLYATVGLAGAKGTTQPSSALDMRAAPRTAVNETARKLLENIQKRFESLNPEFKEMSDVENATIDAEDFHQRSGIRVTLSYQKNAHWVNLFAPTATGEAQQLAGELRPDAGGIVLELVASENRPLMSRAKQWPIARIENERQLKLYYSLSVGTPNKALEDRLDKIISEEVEKVRLSGHSASTTTEPSTQPATTSPR